MNIVIPQVCVYDDFKINFITLLFVNCSMHIIKLIRLGPVFRLGDVILINVYPKLKRVSTFCALKKNRISS